MYFMLQTTTKLHQFLKWRDIEKFGQMLTIHRV